MDPNGTPARLYACVLTRVNRPVSLLPAVELGRRRDGNVGNFQQLPAPVRVCLR